MLEQVRATWLVLVVSLPPVGLVVVACEHDPGLGGPGGPGGQGQSAPSAAISSDTRAASAPQRARDEYAGRAFERFAGSAFGVEQIVRALGASTLSDLRPVGTTSVVLRANLDAPFRAAVKLATHDRPLAPTAEAAAYRLSRCLGLTTVPPAVMRRLPYASFQRALDPRYFERWSELVPRVSVDPLYQIEGAAIFWVEGMRELPIATREAREPVLQVLMQGSAVAADQQLMAAQLSDLSVFDLLLGNGDRWSGGNVQGDVSGQWLYIRDHDLAFATHLRPEVEARLLTQIGQVERFSRSLIERVRALNADSFEREWKKDPLLASRGAWLRERALPGVLMRRAKLLDHVQSLVQRHGQDAVLAFP